jgi:hypothetical protein
MIKVIEGFLVLGYIFIICFIVKQIVDLISNYGIM